MSPAYRLMKHPVAGATGQDRIPISGFAALLIEALRQVPPSLVLEELPFANLLRLLALFAAQPKQPAQLLEAGHRRSTRYTSPGLIVIAGIEGGLPCCCRAQNIHVTGNLYRERQSTPHLHLSEEHPYGLRRRDPKARKHGLGLFLEARLDSRANNCFFHVAFVAQLSHAASGLLDFFTPLSSTRTRCRCGPL
jgi:hypothetical protein